MQGLILGPVCPVIFNYLKISTTLIIKLLMSQYYEEYVTVRKGVATPSGT